MSAPVSSSSTSVLSLGSAVAPAGVGTAAAPSQASASGAALSTDAAGLPQGNDFESILSPMLQAEGAASATDAAALLKGLQLAIGNALADGKAGVQVANELNAGRKTIATDGSGSPAHGNALPAGELPVAVADLATLVGAMEGLQALAQQSSSGVDELASSADAQAEDAVLDASLLLADGMPVIPVVAPQQALDAAAAVNAHVASSIQTAMDITDESLLSPLNVKEASTAATTMLTADVAALKDDANPAATLAVTSSPANSSVTDSAIEVDTTSAATSDLELPQEALSAIDAANTGLRRGVDATDKESFVRLLSASVSQAAPAGSNDVSMTMTDTRMSTGAVAYRMQGQEMIASTVIPQTFGSDGWSDQVSDRIVWFSNNRIQHAEIELDPPELGPLQVRISTQNDQTTVSFVSHHAAVREVLDQNLPKLRELFADQGLNLVQADVNERHGAARDQQGNGAEQTMSGDALADEETDNNDPQSGTVVVGGRVGLVDAFV